MASFLRLPSRLRAPMSSFPLRRNAINSFNQRASVHDTSQKFSQANEHDLQEGCDLGSTPNHPIPSNKAHPTLRDGRQSNLADMEGKRHEDLPEDVRKHNEEMEHRYDRTYSHIADEGKVEKAFEKK
ncbi:uncharacterized protein KD926_010805 [Aspergillus affinis]|uniref:uncharacterized protein n=1 Tax=Aspergillus affinis TaxID=1070780 RepID=UPI0022FE7970|nr:uncharacterized protein KD926_010805 [Aspergillus affinis]KAI9038388.1 hypothetical protein KD926_010805 [Aspergillus affinis]